MDISNEVIMNYVNRLDRIDAVSKGVEQKVDWLYARGLSGESEYLWNILKDKVPLRSDTLNKPDLARWCQRIYDELVPDGKKIKKARVWGALLTCQSAGRVGEPYAVMICSLGVEGT
jgi:hypothetical protein